jgi:hypothetical protein
MDLRMLRRRLTSSEYFWISLLTLALVLLLAVLSLVSAFTSPLMSLTFAVAALLVYAFGLPQVTRLMLKHRPVVLTFRERAEMDEYAYRRLAQSRSGAVVANFAIDFPSNYAQRVHDLVVRRREEGWEFRRFFLSVTAEKVSTLEAVVLDKGLHTCEAFQLKCASPSVKEPTFHRLMPSFMVIDGREVFIGFLSTEWAASERESAAGGHGAPALNLYVFDADVAKQFGDYFEQIWSGFPGAELVKGRGLVSQEHVEAKFKAIKKQLSSNDR